MAKMAKHQDPNIVLTCSEIALVGMTRAQMLTVPTDGTSVFFGDLGLATTTQRRRRS